MCDFFIFIVFVVKKSDWKLFYCLNMYVYGVKNIIVYFVIKKINKLNLEIVWDL